MGGRQAMVGGGIHLGPHQAFLLPTTLFKKVQGQLSLILCLQPLPLPRQAPTAHTCLLSTPSNNHTEPVALQPRAGAPLTVLLVNFYFGAIGEMTFGGQSYLLGREPARITACSPSTVKPAHGPILPLRLLCKVLKVTSSSPLTGK